MSKTASEPVSGELVHYDSAIDELNAYIGGLEPEDEADVAERILRNILRAGTPDELADAGGTVKATDLLNIHLRAHAIHPAESSFKGGLKWYLHVDVETVANGDRMTMSGGGQDVSIKLAQAAHRGWLPFDFKMERSERATKDGYYPIFMRSMRPPENGKRDQHPGAQNVVTEGGGDPF